MLNKISINNSVSWFMARYQNNDGKTHVYMNRFGKYGFNILSHYDCNIFHTHNSDFWTCPITVGGYTEARILSSGIIDMNHVKPYTWNFNHHSTPYLYIGAGAPDQYKDVDITQPMPINNTNRVVTLISYSGNFHKHDYWFHKNNIHKGLLPKVSNTIGDYHEIKGYIIDRL